MKELQQKLEEYTDEVKSFNPTSWEEAEQFRIKFLGTKGILKDLWIDYLSLSDHPGKSKFVEDFKKFKQLTEIQYSKFVVL